MEKLLGKLGTEYVLSIKKGLTVRGAVNNCSSSLKLHFFEDNAPRLPSHRKYIREE